jgi:hypothetical protein
MGIIGLETFITNVHKNLNGDFSHPSSPFKLVPLRNIKLVIDGNQLPYLICSQMQSNHFGGNYDQLYEVIKSALTQLMPYIEMIVFDGSKEDKEKATKRFSQRILYMSKSQSKKKSDEAKRKPPFFLRMILFKVIRELNIKHCMTSGMADHAVACYANGVGNGSSEKFSVYSRDSYFFAYNLEKGKKKFFGSKLLCCVCI